MLRKDITKAIVENGVMVRRTLEEVVNINGINYRTDDPDAKAVGVYEYWYDESNPPAGKKRTGVFLSIDAVAGTVTETAVFDSLSIREQIAALEATQTPRRVREGGQWMVDLEAQIAALRVLL